MSNPTIGRVSGLIGLTVATWLASLLIALVFSRFVPQQLPLAPDHELRKLQQQLLSEEGISDKDLKRAERRIQELQTDVRRKISAEALPARLVRIQDHAVIVSWVPWLLFAMFALRKLQDLLAPLIVVGGLYALGLNSVFGSVVALVVAAAVAFGRQVAWKPREQNAP